MPRFYFHMQTDTRHTDVDGADYDTYAEARKAAIQTCGQMMQDAPETFWGSRLWSVTVTDDAGLIMWEIQLDGQSTAASRGLEGQRA
jgi:uncharacterized glyoxalase superfamily protein PhnB